MALKVFVKIHAKKKLRTVKHVALIINVKTIQNANKSSAKRKYKKMVPVKIVGDAKRIYFVTKKLIQDIVDLVIL